MKPATRAVEGSPRLLPANQQPRHSPPVDGRRGDGDAGEAGTEHATTATSAATSPWRGERARDRATSGRGAVDGPGQSETSGSGGTDVAAGGRRDRRRPGAAAVRARRKRNRPAASDRAGLGGLGARVEATRRDDDDPLGGISR